MAHPLTWTGVGYKLRPMYGIGKQLISGMMALNKRAISGLLVPMR